MKNHPYRARPTAITEPRYLVHEAMLWLGHRIVQSEFWILAFAIVAAVWP